MASTEIGSPSPEVLDALLQLADAPADKKKARYASLFSSIQSSLSPETAAPNLVAYAETILNDNFNIADARKLLDAFVAHFDTLPPTTRIQVGTHVLDALQPRVVSYEELDYKLKESLANAYEAEEDYQGSAKILQRIGLDSQQRTVTDDDRAAVWIRIVRCYLEEDDPTSATGYLNRIKNIYFNIKNQETKLNFQLSQARIQDAQRNFLDAASAYHNVSFESIVDEEERLMMLGRAVNCGVLAPAGPQRQKVLARLHKDDRASQLQQFPILEKIFLNRLLNPDEVSAFAAQLDQHQLARTADGNTVLDKAVLEHNLQAASRIYANISFAGLGELLGATPEKAENYAALMIEQGRLAGSIDQIAEFIFFEGEGSGERKTSHREREIGRELRKWDANVQALTEEVEKVATLIQKADPALYEAQMAMA